MESLVASSETHLLGSLDFRPGKTGQYVTSRRSVTMHPGSGNVFSAAGIRTIRFTIAGSDWLVPETARIGLTIHNTGGNLSLQPTSVLGGSLFSRLRVMSGGVLLEDINLYNRQVNTFANCLPPARQFLDAAEGFGCANNQVPGLSFIDWIPEQIPGNSHRRIFFNLMSGILSQHLWIPLAYMPLTIELEVAPYNEPLQSPTATPTWP